ncbi:hypothetical protein ACNHKD_09045 [Methylocystis sp. JAN1]|uniref:hypothetical protein n=1 Tax=Methylocystis sp. JAN1 TaxID=3397211 RepID=UPI003FA29914
MTADFDRLTGGDLLLRLGRRDVGHVDAPPNVFASLDRIASLTQQFRTSACPNRRRAVRLRTS